MATLSSTSTRMPRSPQAAKRLLIVDDNDHIRTVLKELLISDGYQVETADDGDTGIKAFLQFRPDLIITDIYMPRVPGTQMVSDIKQNFPDAKVIVMSGGSARSKTTYTIDDRLGIYKVLNKPITHADMKAAVEEALSYA